MTWFFVWIFLLVVMATWIGIVLLQQALTFWTVSCTVWGVRCFG